jgi:hypothetical protein
MNLKDSRDNGKTGCTKGDPTRDDRGQTQKSQKTLLSLHGPIMDGTKKELQHAGVRGRVYITQMPENRGENAFFVETLCEVELGLVLWISLRLLCFSLGSTSCPVCVWLSMYLTMTVFICMYVYVYICVKKCEGA